jgi:excisionase family DNA binding protein
MRPKNEHRDKEPPDKEPSNKEPLDTRSLRRWGIGAGVQVREDPPGQDDNVQACGLPRLLTYDDVSKQTGLTKGTLYSLVARGELPHLRLGPRFVRFTSVQIEEWLARRTFVSTFTL